MNEIKKMLEEMVRTAVEKERRQIEQEVRAKIAAEGKRPSSGFFRAGERRELLLEVESRKQLSPSVVRLILRDAAGRAYRWDATSVSGHSLMPHTTVVARATVHDSSDDVIELSHCRLSEVA